MSVNTLCRVCAHDQSMDQMVNIFETIGGRETIAASIIELTGLVVIENDGLPSLCCVQCQSDLIYSVAIRRKCLEAENTLKAVLQMTPIKLDIQEISPKEERNSDLPLYMESSVANGTSKTRVLNHKCCGCSLSFETENELMEHSRLIHATNPPLPDPTRPFQCNVCYRWIKTQKGVEVHKRRLENRRFHAESSVQRLEIPIAEYDEKSIANGNSNTFAGDLANVDDIKQEDPTDVDDFKIFECNVDATSFEEENHKCCGCPMNFDSEIKLMEHSKAVHAPDAPKPNEMKPFQCEICYSLYQTARAARIHRSLWLRRFCCNLCGALFKSVTARLKHHRNVHTVQSTKAVSKRKINRLVGGLPTASVKSQIDSAKGSNKNENPSMTSGSSQHYDRTHDSDSSTAINAAEEKEYGSQEKHTCCGCRVQFDTENELMEHSKTVHASNAPKPNETKSFQCEICYNLFNTTRAVKIHRSFFSQRRSCCTVCGTALKNATAILKHEKCLLKHVNQYPCKLCGESFTNWTARKNHEQHVHLDSIEQSYKCCGCFSQFRTENEMLDHSRLVHAPGAPPPAEERPFQCTTCYRSFKTAGELKTHWGLRKYSFQCRTCEKQFSCYSSLVRHENLHNESVTRPCKYCGEEFSNRLELRKHERRVHEKERANSLQHVCTVCGKSFRSADYLKIHMKLHSDETPHKCFCGAQFKLKVYLTSHRKTAHNEGNTCKYCKKSFAYASLLKEHENQHTGNKEFQCEICGKEFYTRSNMRLHREKVHEKIKKRAKAIGESGKTCSVMKS